MATKQISSKDPAETILVVFDFSELLTVIDSIVGVSIALKSGADTNASGMLQGEPQFDGTKVMQLIKGGVNGASYKLRAEVATGPEQFVLTGILPVNEA